MNKMHKTQIGILNKLLFSTEARYTDLKIDKNIENNTFQFHLDKLIGVNLVQKTDNLYSLTKQGKKLATHIDTDKNDFVQMRKVSVHLFCIKSKSKNPEVLIYKRLKQPFYGKQGFPAGKVKVGEMIVEAAKRELKEETNLGGEFTLFNIAHILVKDKESGNLLDDKIFYDFYIEDPVGELIGNNEGDFGWIKVSEFEKIVTDPFESNNTYLNKINQIINFSGSVTFEEYEHFTDDF